MPKYYRKKSGINNWGLFAAKNFQKGERVIEYKGKKYTHKEVEDDERFDNSKAIYCLLYTSPSPRDRQKSRMPSSA